MENSPDREWTAYVQQIPGVWRTEFLDDEHRVVACLVMRENQPKPSLVLFPSRRMRYRAARHKLDRDNLAAFAACTWEHGAPLTAVVNDQTKVKELFAALLARNMNYLTNTAFV